VTACRHPDTKTDRHLLEETRAGRAESFELSYIPDSGPDSPPCPRTRARYSSAGSASAFP